MAMFVDAQQMHDLQVELSPRPNKTDRLLFPGKEEEKCDEDLDDEPSKEPSSEAVFLTKFGKKRTRIDDLSEDDDKKRKKVE